MQIQEKNKIKLNFLNTLGYKENILNNFNIVLNLIKESNPMLVENFQQEIEKYDIPVTNNDIEKYGFKSENQEYISLINENNLVKESIAIKKVWEEYQNLYKQKINYENFIKTENEISKSQEELLKKLKNKFITKKGNKIKYKIKNYNKITKEFEIYITNEEKNKTKIEKYNLNDLSNLKEIESKYGLVTKELIDNLKLYNKNKNEVKPLSPEKVGKLLKNSELLDKVLRNSESFINNKRMDLASDILYKNIINIKGVSFKKETLKVSYDKGQSLLNKIEEYIKTNKEYSNYSIEQFVKEVVEDKIVPDDVKLITQIKKYNLNNKSNVNIIIRDTMNLFNEELKNIEKNLLLGVANGNSGIEQVKASLKNINNIIENITININNGLKDVIDIDKKVHAKIEKEIVKTIGSTILPKLFNNTNLKLEELLRTNVSITKQEKMKNLLFDTNIFNNEISSLEDLKYNINELEKNITNSIKNNEFSLDINQDVISEQSFSEKVILGKEENPNKVFTQNLSKFLEGNKKEWKVLVNELKRSSILPDGYNKDVTLLGQELERFFITNKLDKFMNETQKNLFFSKIENYNKQVDIIISKIALEKNPEKLYQQLYEEFLKIENQLSQEIEIFRMFKNINSQQLKAAEEQNFLKVSTLEINKVVGMEIPNLIEEISNSITLENLNNIDEKNKDKIIFGKISQLLEKKLLQDKEKYKASVKKILENFETTISEDGQLIIGMGFTVNKKTNKAKTSPTIEIALDNVAEKIVNYYINSNKNILLNNIKQEIAINLGVKFQNPLIETNKEVIKNFIENISNNKEIQENKNKILNEKLSHNSFAENIVNERIKVKDLINKYFSKGMLNKLNQLETLIENNLDNKELLEYKELFKQYKIELKNMENFLSSKILSDILLNEENFEINQEYVNKILHYEMNKLLGTFHENDMKIKNLLDKIENNPNFTKQKELKELKKDFNNNMQKNMFYISKEEYLKEKQKISLKQNQIENISQIYYQILNKKNLNFNKHNDLLKSKLNVISILKDFDIIYNSLSPEEQKKYENIKKLNINIINKLENSSNKENNINFESNLQNLNIKDKEILNIIEFLKNNELDNLNRLEKIYKKSIYFENDLKNKTKDIIKLRNLQNLNQSNKTSENMGIDNITQILPKMVSKSMSENNVNNTILIGKLNTDLVLSSNEEENLIKEKKTDIKIKRASLTSKEEIKYLLKNKFNLSEQELKDLNVNEEVILEYSFDSSKYFQNIKDEFNNNQQNNINNLIKDFNIELEKASKMLNDGIITDVSNYADKIIDSIITKHKENLKDIKTLNIKDLQRHFKYSMINGLNKNIRYGQFNIKTRTLYKAKRLELTNLSKSEKLFITKILKGRNKDKILNKEEILNVILKDLNLTKEDLKEGKNFSKVLKLFYIGEKVAPKYFDKNKLVSFIMNNNNIPNIIKEEYLINNPNKNEINQKIKTKDRIKFKIENLENKIKEIYEQLDNKNKKQLLKILKLKDINSINISNTDYKSYERKITKFIKTTNRKQSEKYIKSLFSKYNNNQNLNKNIDLITKIKEENGIISGQKIQLEQKNKILENSKYLNELNNLFLKETLYQEIVGQKLLYNKVDLDNNKIQQLISKGELNIELLEDIDFQKILSSNTSNININIKLHMNNKDEIISVNMSKIDFFKRFKDTIELLTNKNMNINNKEVNNLINNLTNGILETNNRKKPFDLIIKDKNLIYELEGEYYIKHNNNKFLNLKTNKLVQYSTIEGKKYKNLSFEEYLIKNYQDSNIINKSILLFKNKIYKRQISNKGLKYINDKKYILMEDLDNTVNLLNFVEKENNEIEKFNNSKINLLDLYTFKEVEGENNSYINLKDSKIRNVVNTLLFEQEISNLKVSVLEDLKDNVKLLNTKNKNNELYNENIKLLNSYSLNKRKNLEKQEKIIIEKNKKIKPTKTILNTLLDLKIKQELFKTSYIMSMLETSTKRRKDSLEQYSKVYTYLKTTILNEIEYKIENNKDYNIEEMNKEIENLIDNKLKDIKKITLEANKKNIEKEPNKKQLYINQILLKEFKNYLLNSSLNKENLKYLNKLDNIDLKNEEEINKYINEIKNTKIFDQFNKNKSSFNLKEINNYMDSEIESNKSISIQTRIFEGKAFIFSSIVNGKITTDRNEDMVNYSTIIKLLTNSNDIEKLENKKDLVINLIKKYKISLFDIDKILYNDIEENERLKNFNKELKNNFENKIIKNIDFIIKEELQKLNQEAYTNLNSFNKQETFNKFNYNLKNFILNNKIHTDIFINIQNKLSNFKPNTMEKEPKKQIDNILKFSRTLNNYIKLGTYGEKNNFDTKNIYFNFDENKINNKLQSLGFENLNSIYQQMIYLNDKINNDLFIKNGYKLNKNVIDKLKLFFKNNFDIDLKINNYNIENYDMDYNGNITFYNMETGLIDNLDIKNTKRYENKNNINIFKTQAKSNLEVYNEISDLNKTLFNNTENLVKDLKENSEYKYKSFNNKENKDKKVSLSTFKDNSEINKKRINVIEKELDKYKNKTIHLYEYDKKTGTIIEKHIPLIDILNMGEGQNKTSNIQSMNLLMNLDINEKILEETKKELQSEGIEENHLDYNWKLLEKYGKKIEKEVNRINNITDIEKQKEAKEEFNKQFIIQTELKDGNNIKSVIMKTRRNIQELEKTLKKEKNLERRLEIAKKDPEIKAFLEYNNPEEKIEEMTQFLQKEINYWEEAIQRVPNSITYKNNLKNLKKQKEYYKNILLNGIDLTTNEGISLLKNTLRQLERNNKTSRNNLIKEEAPKKFLGETIKLANGFTDIILPGDFADLFREMKTGLSSGFKSKSSNNMNFGIN